MLSNLEPGSVIRLDTLERAILLMSDLPGLVPGTVLRAGDTLGSSDLVVDVQAGTPRSEALSADNFGSSYRGVARSNATLNWNNPLGSGDRLTLNSLKSEASGLNYVRLCCEQPRWTARA